MTGQETETQDLMTIWEAQHPVSSLSHSQEILIHFQEEKQLSRPGAASPPSTLYRKPYCCARERFKAPSPS